MSIIREQNPLATLRDETMSDMYLHAGSSTFQDDVVKGKVFDYGTVRYTTWMKMTSNGLMNTQHPAEVMTVTKDK